MILRKGSSLIVVFVIVFFLVLSSSFSLSARNKTGFGLTYSLNVPCFSGSFRADQFGVGAGVGFLSTEFIYYFINGKYYIPVGRNLDLYTGAGIVGMSVGSLSYQMNVTGLDGFAGVELSFVDTGLPLTVRGGLDYIGFSGYPTAGIFNYHFGVELNF